MIFKEKNYKMNIISEMNISLVRIEDFKK